MPDVRVVVTSGVVTAVVGFAVLLGVNETMHALQRVFVLGAVALLGCWAMLAAVKTDEGRTTVRSMTIGVVLGLLPVGVVGMIVVLVS
jgi:hypothetical protein